MAVSPVVDTEMFNTVIKQKFKLEFYSDTLGAQLAMDAAFPPVLLLDPGGAGRDVLLPPEASSKKQMFIIFNLADAVEALTVKEDSDTTTIISISQAEVGVVYCDGTTWRGFVAVQ